MARRLKHILVFLFVAAPLAAICAEQDSGDAMETVTELLSLSWEELTQLEVSSLARKEQSVKQSPGAAFVITSGYQFKTGQRWTRKIVPTLRRHCH